ncbi:MAG TPA: hypothetical protein VIB82_06720 [Caulobacteraceae bacterium]|jgi:hypothetical protein
MTLPDLRTLTLPQLVLAAGGVIIVLGAIAALSSGGKGRGTGLAVWIMAPFFLAGGALCIWLLINAVKMMGYDF